MKIQLYEPYNSLCSQFLDYEKQKKSEKMYKEIEYKAYNFFLWLQEKKINPKNLNIKYANLYMLEKSRVKNKKGKQISNGTLCNYIKTARRVYNYFIEINYVSSNPFLNIKYPKVGIYITRNVLTESQMCRLLERLSFFDYEKTYRQKVVLYFVHVLSELLFSSGLRINEACNLVEKDIDLKHRLIFVKHGKGNTSRTAFLTSYSCEIIEFYIKYGKSITDKLFYGKNQKKLFGKNKKSISQLFNAKLREICLELNIPVITSHGFRHSLGTQLLRAGCDIRYIQEILGHKKISSTQIYTRVFSDDLKNSLTNFHPRQKRK